MAAKYGKVDVAELLLERGANPNAAGKVCTQDLDVPGDSSNSFILFFTINLIVNVS